MQNSSYQCGNAVKSFSLIDGIEIPDKVILVDDVVDSRWTLTACGHYLCEGGCIEVYPFALADSSQKED
jgi:ATP-dependent DNA helicase RecQ